MENKIGKGKQNSFKFAPYIVAWVDLLGYGKMLSDCHYDPSSEIARAAVTRIELLNKVSMQHSSPWFTTLQINDGIVAWRELSFRTKSVTQDFIARSIDFFNEITKNEKEMEFPGPRMVIATGIRLKMENSHRMISDGNAQKLIQQVQEGLISAEEAIHKACSYRVYSNAISELQANFAFSKAYIAEGEGKNGGFPGNNVFIDMSIFENENLQSLVIDTPFKWEAKNAKGLESIFARIIKYDRDIFMRYSESEISSTERISKKNLHNVVDSEVIKRLL